MSVTRIVNKTVGPGGWTKWSFVHILGVSTNVVRVPLLMINFIRRVNLIFPTVSLMAGLLRPLSKREVWEDASADMGSTALSIPRGPYPTS